MIRKLCLGIGMVAAMLVAPRAQAAVPNRLVEEGRLVDGSGNPVAGSVTVTFNLYDSATSTTPLWTETQTVTVTMGYFTAELGTTVSFPSGSFDGTARFLGLAVDTDAEMQPRQVIDSVPYALVANDVTGDAHPTSVTVNGTLLIDANGNWVGNPTGLQGPVGPTGPQGVAGATGAQGAAGVVGAAGPTGAQGPQGLAGATGAQGPQGLVGATGAQGPQGLAGATGAQGLAGATGSQGPQGLAGVQGPQGVVGAQGVQGPQGVVGTQGPAGPTGATGAQGSQGVAGATGAQGPIGPAGATGAQGASGTNNQNVFSAYGTGTATVVANSTSFLIVPGLTLTVVVPANSKLLISSYGGFYTNATTAGGFSTVDFALVIDGSLPANGGYQRIVAANNAGVSNVIGNWSFSTSQTLAAGSHTINVETLWFAGSTAIVGGGVNAATQGELDVTIINL